MLNEIKVGPFKFYQYSLCENKPKNSKKMFHTYRNFYEKQKIKNHIEVMQHNMRFDLENLTREKLLSQVHKDVRHDLKKALEKNFKVCEVSKEEFVEKYNDFARNKKINGITEKIIENLSQENNIHMAKSVYENMDLAYNLTVYNSDKCISVMGFPNRFQFEKPNQRLTAYGYRQLIFEDIIFFANKKIKYWDWGGCSINDKNLDIARFSEAKSYFNGEIVEVYEYQSPGYYLIDKLKKSVEGITRGKIQYLWSLIKEGQGKKG